MKKSNRTAARFARFIKCVFTSKAYDHMVFANQLPIAIKSFVQNHFTGQSISFVERSANATGYVLSLNNGSEVSLNPNGSWN